MGFVHIDHVGIVAYTIEQAQEILGDALGLELDEPRSQWPTGTYFAPEQTYNFFFQVGEGETQVEVLDSGEGCDLRRGPLSRTTGPGHAPPVLTPARTCTPRPSGCWPTGCRRSTYPERADGRRNVAFFHPRSTGGILTELVPVRADLLATPRVHRPH